MGMLTLMHMTRSTSGKAGKHCFSVNYSTFAIQFIDQLAISDVGDCPVGGDRVP